MLLSVGVLLLFDKLADLASI